MRGTSCCLGFGVVVDVTWQWQRHQSTVFVASCLLCSVVMLGPSGAGKSNLVSRFINDRFNAESEVTIGVDFASKVMETFDGVKVKTQVWDTGAKSTFLAPFRPVSQECLCGCYVSTAGQERFRAMVSSYVSSCMSICPSNLPNCVWLNTFGCRFVSQVLSWRPRCPVSVRHHIT